MKSTQFIEIIRDKEKLWPLVEVTLGIGSQLLLVLRNLVRAKGRNKVRREEIQEYLPKITRILRQAGYQIGKTPEKALAMACFSYDRLAVCHRPL